MNEKIYLVNKLNHELTFKSGALNLPAFGYTSIVSSEQNEVSIAHALSMDWAFLTDKEPQTNALTKSEINVVVTDPYKGMTAEELKASKETEVKTDPAISTALGQDSTNEISVADLQSLDNKVEDITETSESSTKKTKKQKAE
jgi:hypothetical protein